MGILNLKNLSKRFNGAAKYALRDVTLDVAKGEVLGLIGESGSGKTTLVRLIAGFEVPTAGEIVIEQRPVSSATTFVPPEQRGVGMVFQDCALFPHLNVFQNIGFGLKRLGKAELKKRVGDLVALIGLNGFEKQFPHELSGGEQQRVALARALAPKPSLLLLDEPFSNLNDTLKVAMRTEVKKILKQTEATTILVTHDTDDALSISARVAVLREGRLQQVDTPERIYTQPSNTYVAGLFGDTNILSARPASNGGFESPIGCVETQAPLGKRSEVLLAIRPNSFSIVDDCEGSICAEVEEVIFHGNHKALLLSACDREGSAYRFTMHVEPNYEIKIRQRIHVKPITEKIHIIQRGA